MTEHTPPTRDRLLGAAIALFQERGYHGTSIADLLAAADAPKGSLYHHFPKGKPDIARAAADMASDLMLDIVARAYDPARTFGEGTKRLCEKLARLFERHPHWRACPVNTLLLDGPLEREAAERILRSWIAATAAQGTRLGRARAGPESERLWMLVIGAWTIARIEGRADPLRDLSKIM